MAERESAGPVERPTLRRAVRHALRRIAPGIRVVAEDFLTVASRIDLLGVGREGELVSVRVARHGEEAALFAQVLGDLAWLRPRAADLAKLAPGLGIEPSAAPRAVLLAPVLDPVILAAAATVDAVGVELRGYRCWRERGRLTAWIDPPARSDRAERAAGGGAADRAADVPDAGLAADRPARGPAAGGATDPAVPTPAGGVSHEALPAHPTPSPATPAGAEPWSTVQPDLGSAPARVPDAHEGGFRTGLRDEDIHLEDLETGRGRRHDAADGDHPLPLN
jgi:hypothetical protein